jgi:hypothetical protein
MMCNPNITPSGATQTGSKTGSWPQITNQFLCANELFENATHEIAKIVAKLREVWIRKQLLEHGFPQELIPGLENRECLERCKAVEWIRANGFSIRLDLLNTIELFKNGESVAFATLFKMHRTDEHEIKDTPLAY